MTLYQLRERSVGNELQTIRHEYTEAELHDLRDEYSQMGIRIADETELQATRKKEMKQTLDALYDASDTFLDRIRDRYEDRKIECLLVPNFEAGEMEYYDSTDGSMVDKRRLRPNERQMTFGMAHAA
jgi:hypothetical protein